MKYRLDRWARRLDGGSVLLGGAPTRLFRLGARGQAALDAIERAEDAPRWAAALVDRLVDAGALHPQPEHLSTSLRPSDVTVVVPIRDRDPRPTLAGLGDRSRVVLVDDGSTVPVPAPDGVEVFRLDASPAGPAGARNAGLGAVTTPIVAFVDSDVVPHAGWLTALLGHFDDPTVALVAPRVVAVGGGPVLGAYEAARSPLDLGAEPAPVRPGGRVAYVPAAAVVCRAEAMRALGGFDEALRTGEDVDLVWRLVRAGWRCRYEPAAVVGHEVRPSLRAMVRQRAAYGRAAAPLALRHGDAVAPCRLSPVGVAAAATTALGHPLVAVAVTAAPAVPLARRTRLGPGDTARLTLAGSRSVFEQLASATTRPWLPLALLACLVSRRARRWLLVATLAPAVRDWLRLRPALDPARFTALRIVDDAAYGVGVWQGCVRTRTIQPLLPAVTRRARRDRPPG